MLTALAWGCVLGVLAIGGSVFALALAEAFVQGTRNEPFMQGGGAGGDAPSAGELSGVVGPCGREFR